MGAAIFISKSQQKQFANNGFVKLPLLSPDEIDKVSEKYRLFASQHSSPGNKFHGTGWLENPEQRIKVSQCVFPILQKAAEKVFVNHKIIGCSFLQKEKGNDSGVELHQDWTYVDESKFYSLNIWVALEDITIKNGGMFVVPFSHKIFSRYLRPAPSYPVPFKKIISLISLFRVPIKLKRGECLCFNNALLHGSFPNLQESKRLALVATVLPLNAELIHHYVSDVNEPETITEYYLDEESFLKIERGLPPANFIEKRERKTVFVHRSKWFFLHNFFVRRLIALFSF